MVGVLLYQKKKPEMPIINYDQLFEIIWDNVIQKLYTSREFEEVFKSDWNPTEQPTPERVQITIIGADGKSYEISTHINSFNIGTYIKTGDGVYTLFCNDVAAVVVKDYYAGAHSDKYSSIFLKEGILLNSYYVIYTKDIDDYVKAIKERIAFLKDKTEKERVAENAEMAQVVEEMNRTELVECSMEGVKASVECIIGDMEDFLSGVEQFVNDITKSVEDINKRLEILQKNVK